MCHSWKHAEFDNLLTYNRCFQLCKRQISFVSTFYSYRGYTRTWRSTCITRWSIQQRHFFSNRYLRSKFCLCWYARASIWFSASLVWLVGPLFRFLARFPILLLFFFPLFPRIVIVVFIWALVNDVAIYYGAQMSQIKCGRGNNQQYSVKTNHERSYLNWKVHGWGLQIVLFMFALILTVLHLLSKYLRQSYLSYNSMSSVPGLEYSFSVYRYV